MGVSAWQKMPNVSIFNLFYIIWGRLVFFSKKTWQAFWSDFQQSEATWSHSKQSETILSNLKQCEAIWSMLMQSEAIRANQKQCDATWDKFNKKTLKILGIWSNLKQICSNQKRIEAIWSNLANLKQPEAMWDNLKQSEANSNHLKQFEAIRSDLKQSGAIWSNLRQIHGKLRFRVLWQPGWGRPIWRAQSSRIKYRL